MRHRLLQRAGRFHPRRCQVGRAHSPGARRCVAEAQEIGGALLQVLVRRFGRRRRRRGTPHSHPSCRDKVDHPLMCSHHEQAVSIAEECAFKPRVHQFQDHGQEELELLVLPFIKTLAMGHAAPGRGKLNIDTPAPRSIPCCPLM